MSLPSPQLPRLLDLYQRVYAHANELGFNRWRRRFAAIPDDIGAWEDEPHTRGYYPPLKDRPNDGGSLSSVFPEEKERYGKERHPELARRCLRLVRRCAEWNSIRARLADRIRDLVGDATADQPLALDDGVSVWLLTTTDEHGDTAVRLRPVPRLRIEKWRRNSSKQEKNHE